MKKHIIKGLIGLATIFLSPMVVVFVGCVGFAAYQLFLGIPIAQSIQDFKHLLIAYFPYISLTTKWVTLIGVLGLLWQQRHRIKKAAAPLFKSK